jgi:hypothetical protein
MNANNYIKKEYENKTPGKSGKNKANSKPICSELACPERGRRGLNYFKHFLAKWDPYELKYIDRLGKLTLNLIKSSDSPLNDDNEKESITESIK